MQKKGVILGIILIILALIVLGLFIFYKQPVEPIVPIESGCLVDSDCVPSSCCHAKTCVFKKDAPVCKGIACTMSCEPNTLDCGQGSCKCTQGKCGAIFS